MFFILLIKKILLLTHLCTVTSMLDDLSYGYINNIVRRDHTSLKKWCWPCTDWLCFAWIAFALLFQINSSYQENNENDNGFLFQDKKFIETFDMIVVSNSSFICTVGQKKKWNPPINSNKNQRRELKLVPINMDYCLLQFHALKIFLGVRLHGDLYLILLFSM